MLPLPEKQDVSRWTRELKAAGWKEHRIGVWLHPDGRYYRGPYLAWCVMRAERGLSVTENG